MENIINRDQMSMNIEFHYQFPCCEDHEGSTFTAHELVTGDQFQCEICHAWFIFGVDNV